MTITEKKRLDPELCTCTRCWEGVRVPLGEQTKAMCFHHGCACCREDHGYDFAEAIAQALQACCPREALIPFPVLALLERERPIR